MPNSYKPLKFFSLTLFITWVSWFLAAYFSYQIGQTGLEILFMVPGLLAPALVALFMIFTSKSPELKRDMFKRLSNLRLIKLKYMPIISLLMPISILLSVSISLLFGMSPDQFQLTEQINILKGEVLLSLLIPILAPTFEEIGWRGYGVDSLRSKFSVIKTSIIFALLWALWHLPLFFINDYYQNQLWKLGIIYVINFFVSIFPLAIILNWLYYKNNRSIISAILFHIITVISAEAFSTNESTKFIQTGILTIVAIGIIIHNKKLFFNTTANEI